MTVRARTAGMMVASFAAMTIAACEAPLGPADPSVEPLSGEWFACLNDGAADHSRQVQFFPDSFASTIRTYATTDRTCGGAETSASREIWRYRLAESVPAQIPGIGTAVLAREMNVENSFETLYTIVYLDAQASPQRLYFGDVALDPMQDGTAPEKRPDVLSVSTVLTGD